MRRIANWSVGLHVLQRGVRAEGAVNGGGPLGVRFGAPLQGRNTPALCTPMIGSPFRLLFVPPSHSFLKLCAFGCNPGALGGWLC